MDAEIIGNNETLENEGLADIPVETVEENIVVVKAPPFATINLDPTEVLLIYQALRLSLRNLSQQEQEPLDSIDKITHLMRVIKPAATQAAQIYQTNGIVAPE